MFKIIISSRAQKELRKISREHQKAIRLALLELKEDPGVGKPLTKELRGKFSYRVGLYRIIYKVDKPDKTISILTAGHRASVYK